MGMLIDDMYVAQSAAFEQPKKRCPNVEIGPSDIIRRSQDLAKGKLALSKTVTIRHDAKT